VGLAILTLAALSFLGLGPRPPMPELGLMIALARNFLPDWWWLTVAPGLAIAVTVFAFNLLGDGLRDWLDPRLSGATHAQAGARRRPRRNGTPHARRRAARSLSRRH